MMLPWPFPWARAKTCDLDGGIHPASARHGGQNVRGARSHNARRQGVNGPARDAVEGSLPDEVGQSCRV